jgi:hypothetical protein
LLWFENLWARAGLSPVIGAVVIGWVPFAVIELLVLLLILIPLLGQSYIAFLLANLAWTLPTVLATILGARFIARLLARLREYTSAISADHSEIRIQPLYELRGIFATYFVLITGFIPAFLRPGLSLVQNLEGQLPFFYFNFVEATFLWVLLYGSYSIYKMGKIRMKLKPFTEDRALGLGEFGRISLRVTAIYLAYVSLVLAPVLLFSPFVSGLLPSVLVVVFFLLGFVVFLLPLVSIRAKLVKAKRDELGKLGPRYTRVVATLCQGTEEQYDARLQSELTTILQIRGEISHIHSWPFDVGSFARLSAIIISVAAILLSRILTIALHL